MNCDSIDPEEMPPTDGDMAVVDGGNSTAAMAANEAVSVPFTCNFCQRSFPRLSLLKKHEQVTHPATHQKN